jgi:homoserine kinase
VRMPSAPRPRPPRPTPLNPGAWAEAWAPASVGNVSVGFDLLGHAVGVAGDTVRVARVRRAGVEIAEVSDEGGNRLQGIPTEAAANTAGAALLGMVRDLGLEGPEGFRLWIRKGIPLGSGMGGSAASAVAALTAANALLPEPLPPAALYPWALEGEAVASGAPHGDNVGAQLLGGLVLAFPDRLVPVPLPWPLHCALVHPHQVLETRRARAVLAEPFPLADVVLQSGRLARFLVACHNGDLGLLRGSLDDALVEPRRAPLIPGFATARVAALGAGALGAGISGGGPSVFGWFETPEGAAEGARAMQAAFRSQGIEADAWSAPVAGPGARVVACG